MAGLSSGIKVYPLGYTAPRNEAPAPRLPPALAPSEYNKNELPMPMDARRRTVVAKPGVSWPSPIHKDDKWNNYNNKPSMPLMHRRYNIGALPSSNHNVQPEDTPYSRDGALRLVAAISSGGVVEPKKDVLDIARSFVSTAVDPATKDWWSRRVNSLDQLAVIATTRSLTPQESEIQVRLMKEITDEAAKPASLAINAPPFVPPPAPLTNEDMKLNMTLALRANELRKQKDKGLTPQTLPKQESKGPDVFAPPIQNAPDISPVLKPVTLHFPETKDYSGPPASDPPLSSLSLLTSTASEQDFIGDQQPAPPGGLTVIIKTTDLAFTFRDVMSIFYPTGFTEKDGQVWRNPVALVTGSGQISKLGPAYVSKKAIAARDFTVNTMTDANNIKKTAIAIQYCVEKSPNGPHYQLKDFLATPALLDELFKQSAEGKFMYNRGYKAKLV